MDSRIGQLDVRIRAPAGHAPGLVQATRTFATRVLQRCDELLEERAPGRLVFMRHLDMHWRLRESGVETAGEVDAVASELARALDEAARSARSSPDPADEVVVFADAVHYCAEYLQAVAENRLAACWFFESIAGDAAFRPFYGRMDRRELVGQVVRRLSAHGATERVLSALPPALAEDLLRALDTADTPSRAQKILTAGQSRRSPAIELASRNATDDHPGADVDRTAPTAIPIPNRQQVDTQFGGVFYLLALAMELSLGETLWRACLPEPAVFTRTVTALLGVDASADPAPRLIGGFTLGPDLTRVTLDQHAEVTRAILTALVQALPRHLHSELPPLRLSLRTRETGRLLIATPGASPFVVFAWPADSAETVREGLAAFLAHWPASAPAPLAQPALASVDRSGRIRTDRHAGPPPIVPDHEDLLATAVLAQAAGSVAFLFAARVGEVDISESADLVGRYFRVPARVWLSDDELIVSMAMERIDLAVRRAGLDRDPGWVPWLNRRVTLEFHE